ncbi:hypothetical protein [Azotobacter salinestris]|uniref:hypothetical protein n=1 Tax=Azotobacter salinestris TaxID=69964 RepID=UPI0032E02D78
MFHIKFLFDLKGFDVSTLETSEPLILKGPTGEILLSISKAAPWSAAQLRAIDFEALLGDEFDVCDAYLGNNWIGSTEI